MATKKAIMMESKGASFFFFALKVPKCTFELNVKKYNKNLNRRKQTEKILKYLNEENTEKSIKICLKCNYDSHKYIIENVNNEIKIKGFSILPFVMTPAHFNFKLS